MFWAGVGHGASPHLLLRVGSAGSRPNPVPPPCPPPRPQVSEAVCLDALSYQEAWELAYFGASVLHPRTTQPAMRARVPIAIKNFFNRGAPGTLICETPPPPPAKAAPGAGGDGMVKGFATIDDVALIEVEGTGMVGVPGTASAIFTTVRDAACNVIMISQAGGLGLEGV